MAKPIAHDFALEELASLNPVVKPMFGCHAVYVRDELKLVLITRDREKSPEDNGVWIPVVEGSHASLQSVFPNMRSIAMFGPGPTGWQVLPIEADDFEESVMTLCSLIRANDPRVGTIPKRKLRKKKAKVSKKVRKKASKS